MQQVTLLPGQDGQTFVIGLKWKRIVTGSTADGTDSARKVASEHKSSHMILDRDASKKVRAVGHGFLGKKAPAKVLSLAAAFAHRFAQSDKAILALKLPPESPGAEPLIWLCGVVDGIVYQNTDIIISKAEVPEAVKLITNRFDDGSVEFYGDVLSQSRPMSQAELMAQALSRAGEVVLQKVGHSLTIPKPVLYGLVGLTAILVFNAVHDHIVAKRLAREREAEQAQKSGDPSPQQAWGQAVDKWVSTSDVAPASSLTELLQTVGRLGLDVANWRLGSVDCTRKGQAWRCQADYQRDADRRADSLGFQAALPGGWVPVWKGVDEVAVTFSVPCHAAKFDVKHAMTEDEIHLPLLSEIQRFSKAFDKKELGDFAAVQIAMPKRSDGTVYVIDPQLMKPVIVSAPLTVSGPLRSAFTLLNMPISFTSLKLKVVPGTEPSLGKSALQVEELKGDVYAVH